MKGTMKSLIQTPLFPEFSPDASEMLSQSL